MEDVQLLSLRVLLRMLAHASSLLNDSQSLPHAGARAVLSLLQPRFLLLFLQPNASSRAVVLSLRLLGTLLFLSRRYPAAITFAAAFRDAMGFERLAALLPLHAHVADVYLTLAHLAFGQAPCSLELVPPPESPAALEAACAHLIMRGRPTYKPAVKDLCWMREALSLMSITVREGLRICASGATNNRSAMNAADSETVEISEVVGNAAQSAADVTNLLRMWRALLPLLGAVSDDVERLGPELLAHTDLIEHFCSATGVAWLYASNLVKEGSTATAEGEGGLPSADEVLQPLVLLTQRSILLVPQLVRPLRPFP